MINRILTYFACISLIGATLSPALQIPVVGQELKGATTQKIAQNPEIGRAHV